MTETNSMKRVLILILLAILLAACNPTGTTPAFNTNIPTVPLPSPDPVATRQVEINLPAPPARTPDQGDEALCIVPTPTPKPTITLRRTPASFPSLPVSTPMWADTLIPVGVEAVGEANVQQFRLVAAWRKGSIQGVAFAPDGRSFVVGSAYGIAIYRMDDLVNSPLWVPFDTALAYSGPYYSTDSNYILLDDIRDGQIRSSIDGQIVEGITDIKWSKPVQNTEDREPAFSSDKSLRFETYSTYPEENMNLEISVREVYDQSTGELLYTLPDETQYVNYHDYNKPQGCDLYSFSYCGNVYDPSASTPYEVAFSPNNDTLTILYRARNLWSSNRFSTLRVYQGGDGALLYTIGSFDHPVETFTYGPDGRQLLVAFVDGSIQLLDVQKDIVIYNAWHFSAPLIDLEFTADRQFLVLQTAYGIEVRSTQDGSLRSRFEGVTFAVSPVENQIAIGEKDGVLHLEDLDRGETIFRIQAHTAEIYALAFSPDGLTLTSSGEDCDVRAWEVQTGIFLHFFEENTTDAYFERNTESRIFVYYMQYVSGTNQVLGYGSWGRVVSWNANSGATQYMIEPEPLDYYQGMITLNPHFPEFFGIDTENALFYLDGAAYSLQNGDMVSEPQLPEDLPAGCALSGPQTPDGKLRFTRGYEDLEGRVCILDAVDLHLVQTIQVLPTAMNEIEWMKWLYLSPDGKQLVVDTRSGVLFVYQIVAVE